MAFKASNDVPADAYRRVKGAAVQLKLNCQSFNTQLAASGATYPYLRDIYLTLTRADNQFNALKVTPGLAAYAKDQENDQAYDVVAEFTTMQTALQAVLSWMETNVPVTNRNVPAVTDWGNESTIQIADTFTPAQTNGLQTVLSALIATIE